MKERRCHENETLKARMNEWGELSIKINKFEERIAGVIDAEEEGLKVRLVDGEARVRELDVQVAKIEGLETRIAGMTRLQEEMTRLKIQQEQDSHERAKEIRTLEEKIHELELEGEDRS